MKKERYTPEQEVFGVHFLFNTLTGKELYTHPLLANNSQPERIHFTKFSHAEPVSFHPTPPKDKQSYKLKDEAGYVYYNQYPCPRRDLTEDEGDQRFNLGVEYPFYQSVMDTLPAGTQYEYCELEFFLNKCVRGITELTSILETRDKHDPEHVKRAKAKGEALERLYLETLTAFVKKYPDYTFVYEMKPGALYTTVTIAKVVEV